MSGASSESTNVSVIKTEL